MKYIISLLIMVLLVGCSAGDSPEKAVQEWTQARLTADGNKTLERTCRADHAKVQGSGAMMSAVLSFGQVGDKKVEFNFGDMQVKVISQNGNAAQVHVSGRIRVSLMGVGQEVPIADRDIPLINEDGRWKVCGITS